MNKKVKQLLLLLCLSLLLSLPYFVFAADTSTSENSPLGKMQIVAESSYETADSGALMTYAGQFISIILGLLGIIFTCLLIYAGFNWMTAAGDTDDVKKAKLTHKNKKFKQKQIRKTKKNKNIRKLYQKK